MGKKKEAKKALKKAAKVAARKKQQEKRMKSAAAAAGIAQAVRAMEEASEAMPAIALELADEKAAAQKVPKPEAPEAPAQKTPAYTPVEGEPMKTVSIKMPVSLVEAADAAAKAYAPEGVSRSEYIRLAIEKLLNE